jgi:hypothetical protein
MGDRRRLRECREARWESIRVEHMLGNALQPRGSQATLRRPGRSVCPNTNPVFDEEPQGGEKKGGSDGAGDRPAVGQSSPPAKT